MQHAKTHLLAFFGYECPHRKQCCHSKRKKLLVASRVSSVKPKLLRLDVASLRVDAACAWCETTSMRFSCEQRSGFISWKEKGIQQTGQGRTSPLSNRDLQQASLNLRWFQLHNKAFLSSEICSAADSIARECSWIFRRVGWGIPEVWRVFSCGTGHAFIQESQICKVGQGIPAARKECIL